MESRTTHRNYMTATNRPILRSTITTDPSLSVREQNSYALSHTSQACLPHLPRLPCPCMPIPFCMAAPRYLPMDILPGLQAPISPAWGLPSTETHAINY